MPEHRGRKHHQDRVAETLREEIGAMIEGELVDPRINLCYVSEVVLNPGGKSALVYVAIDSAVKDIHKAEKDTVAGLEAAFRAWAGTLIPGSALRREYTSATIKKPATNTSLRVCSASVRLRIRCATGWIRVCSASG